MTSDEEYLTPPVRDETLQEILEGESWVPPSHARSPTPPPSTAAEYYDQGWSNMDYSCCARDRESTGVQTDAALVELPPSSSEGSSSDSVSTPRENASPIPIPPPVIARANRLRTVTRFHSVDYSNRSTYPVQLSIPSPTVCIRSRLLGINSD